MASPKKSKATTTLKLHSAAARPARPPARIHELEIRLRHVEPQVWRRFAVRSSISLARLHDVIQVVMGWEDCHLHEFATRDRRRFAPRYDELDLDADVIESRRVKVSDVLPKVGARLLYEYDFGDSWEHELKAVAIRAPEPGVRYPRCLAGQGACPPEDVGGPYGYAGMLEALRDPRHAQHDDFVEWVGDAFDPETFDLEGVNKQLASFR
jgi:hypothetical protein